MTENILLFIFAIVIFIATVVIRNAVARRQMQPLSRRKEVLIRIGLCLFFAVIAHAFITGAGAGLMWFFVASFVNAIFIYGCIHLVDGLLLKKKEAPASS